MVDVASTNVASANTASQNIGGRSVQDWIDERPIWPVGTSLPTSPMTHMQWLIWGLAAAGKFFEGFVVFMTGVALPLISAEDARRCSCRTGARRL